MSHPSVSQARAWRPAALLELAEGWDTLATVLAGHAERFSADVERSRDWWRGAAADAARVDAPRVVSTITALARALVSAAVAARDGAQQLDLARSDVLTGVEEARTEGFAVADDAAVTVAAGPAPLMVLLAGGDDAVAATLLAARAGEWERRITERLERLGAADADAAADIADAFGENPPPAATVPAAVGPGPVAGWPTMSQDRIAEQIAEMSPQQRDRLIAEYPRQVGNTDGVPWPMRAAANRINIASAVLTETGADDDSRRRVALYRGLLGEIDDPSGRPGRIERQILAFDPARASLVELNGDLAAARSVAVLVPGVNTRIEDSAANTVTARRFVTATSGDAAVITYLGGPFPQVRDPVDVITEAADARYALDMAPRLVAFSEDVDRVVGDGVPVTVIGHSYGGSIVGTAETQGLTSDRTLFLAAAGAGVGVDDPGDWHNRNPTVLRFSMTAPGDFIEAVQGIPGGPHGADPDEMPTVVRLTTGSYDDGGRVAGWPAHSGMLNRPSDAWRTILAVITGDAPTLHRAAAVS
ncbi:alpha/beta hydrolase [Mycolicibacterium poriferae]|uniref:alpha/beta hydrolase n=1 Tax=Mycolicibacterium poriferae TaxID=39694 RepID=UPI0024B93BCD|nr:alpha/beta hydrolase [Mycolicibacterium poriferae]